MYEICGAVHKRWDSLAKVLIGIVALYSQVGHVQGGKKPIYSNLMFLLF